MCPRSGSLYRRSVFVPSFQFWGPGTPVLGDPSSGFGVQEPEKQLDGIYEKGGLSSTF